MTVSNHSGSGLRPAIAHRQHDVLLRRQRGHQVERLEDEADLVAAQPGELLSLSWDRSVVAEQHLRRSVTVSSAAMQCMSVDLPDPDGPITAVNSPAAKSIETPSSAATVASPSP